MTTFDYSDHKKVEEMVGKTIKSADFIKRGFEIGDNMLLLTFTDGTRQAIYAHSQSAYDPRPPIQEMRKAVRFFTQDDLIKRVEWEEARKKSQKKAAKERRKREYDNLKKEFDDAS
jgi:hypothetical protein